MEFFNFKDSIGRRHYFLGNIVIFLFLIVVLTLNNYYSQIVDKTEDINLLLVMNFTVWGLLVFTIIGIIYSFSLGVRRLHDLGRSGWWILLSWVPLINLALWIYLFFFKGKSNLDTPNPSQSVLST